MLISSQRLLLNLKAWVEVLIVHLVGIDLGLLSWQNRWTLTPIWHWRWDCHIRLLYLMLLLVHGGSSCRTIVMICMCWVWGIDWWWSLWGCVASYCTICIMRKVRIFCPAICRRGPYDLIFLVKLRGSRLWHLLYTRDSNKVWHLISFKYTLIIIKSLLAICCNRYFGSYWVWLEGNLLWWNIVMFILRRIYTTILNGTTLGCRWSIRNEWQ